MPHLLAVTVSLVLLAGAAAGTAQTGDFTHPTAEPSAETPMMDRSDLGNVAQRARMLYAEGLRDMRRADKLEKKLAETEGEKRDELEAKIRGAREGAAAKLVEAIRFNNKLMEAYGALGKVHGQLGQHQQSLQVLSAALQQDPTNEENFRGWAHAMLELNMLGNATQAWGHFHTANPALADILYDEMESWLARRRADPGDLASDEIERMASWLAENG